MYAKRVLAPSLVPIVDRWVEQPPVKFLNALHTQLSKKAVVDANVPCNREEWIRSIKNVHVIAGSIPMTADLLKYADVLEMIQTFGIGYDKIDVSACTEKNILVCNVAEIYSEPVAQHAWALILDLAKKVSLADRSMRDGSWSTRNWMGLQLWGRTLGVIGLGGIGARIAMKGHLAFNMNVLAYDPNVLPGRAQRYGAELVELKTLLEQSDIVSISTPLTPETHHMISAAELSLMKHSAILINTSRGAVIDQEALLACLQKGEIQGAGLDVFETEPLDPCSPLLHLENVVLTPHIASSTSEAIQKTYAEAIANIIRYLSGYQPYWVVNPQVKRNLLIDVI
ncbi:MAG: glycerate dehydrogenase [Candidatus Bathyarchaeota archaeon]|nr:MAG: glycerate dehydrogenase [Candidatus Bathyarchaeota archaeon]